MKTIVGYPNYMITRNGRIWSKPRKIWLKPQTLTKDYLAVSLCKDGVQKTYRIHVLVLETYTGKRPTNTECRHLNGNKQDNRLCNLKWGTPKENANDRLRLDEMATKLTSADVIKIRRLYQSRKFTMEHLAKTFHVCRTTIWFVIHNKTWKHIR